MGFSGYGYESRSNLDPKVVHEKAWKRPLASAYDDRWHALSPAARRAYLDQVKAPTQAADGLQPTSPADRIGPKLLDELVAAGLVRVVTGLIKKPAQVSPRQETYHFALRVRALARSHPLGPADLAALARYVIYSFHNQGEPTINRILRNAGVGTATSLDEGLNLFVGSRHWPDWALKDIGPGAAPALVEALAEAPGPVPLADLPRLMDRKPKGKAKAKGKPQEQATWSGKEVSEALGKLLDRMAVFEDLDPETLDLVVGLLPRVRERIAKAAGPRTRPPLVVSENLKQFAPPSGLFVHDLRTFLLEVAAESPRLRQDGGLFVKEFPRFEEAMATWPDWLYAMLGIKLSDRVEEAFDLAVDFKLVEDDPDDDKARLRLSGQGGRWLASPLEDQYVWLYNRFQGVGAKPPKHAYFDDRRAYGDEDFLGINAAIYVGKAASRSSYYSYIEPKPEHRQALREAIHESFASLPVGVYHRIDSVVAHLAFGEANPLARTLNKLRNLDPVAFLETRLVPNVPEAIESAGIQLLTAILGNRLLVFEAVQVAVDDKGMICLARLPRLDGYFGRPYDAGSADEAGATKVIVQPDFSVVVIGIDPAPLAELAPFCERSGGPIGQGAMTFKITRASVTRAASQGLTAKQIVDRLEKYASVAVPANILTEVREWAGWIRRVNVRKLTIVRCPDPEAADRVLSTLGRRAERIAETIVGLDTDKLPPADRAKLQAAGIIITKDDIGPVAVSKPSPKAAPAPKKKRGRPPKQR